MARARKSRSPTKPAGKKARAPRKPTCAKATKPAPPGRPSLVSDTPEWKAKRKKLLKFLKDGATERAAVMAAGIGLSTYMEAKRIGRTDAPDAQPFREFLEQCIEAMAASRIELEMRVHNGDARLALRVLRARYPRDWNPEAVLRAMAILQGDEEDIGRPVPPVAVRREAQLLDSGDDDELDDVEDVSG